MTELCPYNQMHDGMANVIYFVVFSGFRPCRLTFSYRTLPINTCVLCTISFACSIWKVLVHIFNRNMLIIQMHCHQIRIVLSNVPTVCMQSNYLGQRLQRRGWKINALGSIVFGRRLCTNHSKVIREKRTWNQTGRNSIRIQIRCVGCHSTFPTALNL